MPFQKSLQSGLKGVGVDILSHDRARRFLKNHKQEVWQRCLTQNEKKYFPRKRFSVNHFSKLFTAKEAFFKSLNRSWMGFEGFSEIEITPRPNGRFKARALRPGKCESLTGEGCFFGDVRWTGAQVVRW